MEEQYGLQRFVEAQDHARTFERALGELRAGRKVTHWMWFVFPQVAGLGTSPMAERYSIRSLGEARAYLEHPVLGPRLRHCAEAAAGSPSPSAVDLLGPVDALKLRSSMTLFSRADPTEQSFARVLQRYFGGRPDPMTDRLLGGDVS